MNNLTISEPREIKTAPSYGELTERFLSSQDVKPSSRRLYRRTLKQYFNWIEEKLLNLEAITRKEIIDYKQYLLDAGKSELTVGSYLSVVRKFYEWAEAYKYYPNVAKGIKTPKREKGFKKDPLTIEQIKELLSSIETESPQGKRDYAIVNLMIRTGLRTIEVIRADIEDIGYKAGEMVLFIKGKGRDAKDNFVILTAKAYKPILDYLSTRGKTDGSEPLFTSMSNNSRGERLTTRTISFIVKSRLKGIGLSSGKLTAHSLRHTAGVNVLKAGGDLYTTQLFMRHKDPATTQIYLRTVEEEFRIMNAPEKLLDEKF